jgi:hypothetical protein
VSRKVVTVTTQQIRAARTALKLSEFTGRPVSPAIKRIAAVRLGSDPKEAPAAVPS